ncbi:hypothetical protein LINPERHAP1_LOCUS1378, partial [Linum perenne]
MGVTVTYHFDGRFVENGTNMGYCGGKVVSIADVEPAMINSFDLEDGFKSQVGASGTYMYYF